MWAIVNLIWKKPAKKYLVFTCMSTLVMIVSFIAFGITTDNPASESSISVTNDVPIIAEAPVTAGHEDTPTAQPSSDTAAVLYKPESTQDEDMTED